MIRSAPLVAVYPGTFDPMTLGHEDVVRRATQLFERVIVAGAAGHHKNAMFTLAEPMAMASQMAENYPQVEVESFSGLFRDFVVARGGKAMVRGLRAVTDFDYEFQLAGMNRCLMPDVETVSHPQRQIPIHQQHVCAGGGHAGRGGRQVRLARGAAATFRKGARPGELMIGSVLQRSRGAEAS
jgi:pantetheine-phosphate adenylyltransferase